MPRPYKKRIVNHQPNITYFKPRGVPLSQIEDVQLGVEELEAIRLSDFKNKNQVDAASDMGIHQSTFQRTLIKARNKIADALVNGKAIKISGGDYTMPGGDGTGPFGSGLGKGLARGLRSGFGCGQGRGLGAGSNIKGDFNSKRNNAGPGGKCKCPKCGYEISHVRGQPCNNEICPECETQMIRA